MKVFATWDIPDELRNALLEHLRDLNKLYPGCRFEAFVQSTPTVPMADVLAEPAASIAQIGERQAPAPPSDGSQPSQLERAKAAILTNPGRPARAIAKEIGVGHQTVLRARERLEGESGGNRSIRWSDGPPGPAKPSGRSR
jgi:hypothetical protein